MDVFFILMEVYTFFRIHQIIHLSYVQFTVGKFYNMELEK